jgi:glutamate 5-kinase
LREYDANEKLVRVEVKNNFALGDEIEVVTPNGISISKVEKIYKTKMNHGIKKANTTFIEAVNFDRHQSEEVESAHG